MSRSTYADLFAVIGTTYGAGDGSTTFAIPNIKGRTIVGLNSSDTDFDALGETRGSKTHTLTSSEMPAHTHDVAYFQRTTYTLGGATAGSSLAGNNATATTTSTGGGGAHNNIQPSIVLNYIIKT